MTALTRDAAQIRYWKTQECIHEKDYIITFNDDEVNSEITLCTICNSPLTQTPNKTAADIVDEQINDLNSQTRELYENDRRLKSDIDKIKEDLLQMKTGMKNIQTVKLSCNYCGHSPPYGVIKNEKCKRFGTCEGIYREKIE